MSDESKQRRATSVSWAALLIALICLGFLGWYIPRDRQQYLQAFNDFHAKLSTSVQVMLSLPTATFPLTAVVVAGVAIAIQLRLRNREGAALLHVLIILFCCVVYTTYRQIMFQAMQDLIWSIPLQGGFPVQL